jgi:polysaccharide biosynthesis/export protein
MQNDSFKKYIPTEFNTENKIYRLQPNDVLSVKILSAQPDLVGPYNIMNPNSNLGFAEPGNLFLNGYSIDTNGNISLPEVGKIKVAGLTTAEAEQIVQDRVKQYVTDATAIVKLISFKISVLGEVRNPGHFFIYNERANLFEVLSMAGDLTIGANRDNIKLVRQKPGSSEVILLNLTDPDFVKSEYYYLQPNDVLYVEPRRTFLNRENLTLAGTVFGLISTTVLLLNYLK